MNSKIKWMIPISLSLVLISFAKGDNPLPSPEETNRRLLPDDKTLSGEYEYKKRYTSEAEKNAEIQTQLNQARHELSQKLKNGSGVSGPSTVGKIKKQNLYRPQVMNRVQIPFSDNFQPVQSFLVTKKEEKPVLPLGSHVKAKVLSGVEANTQESYPMLLQLDHAFTGPNKTKVDLSNCFMIAKAKANLSTERVMGETTEISCVRENGEHIKREAKGFIAGDDSTFGMTGQLMSKQGQVLLAAVLANLAKGAGEAVGAAQTTQQAIANQSGTEKISNVTGNKAAFVGGKAVADSASIIASWYLDYARQVIPSIAVGSGKDVWVVMLDSVQLPELSTDEDGESYEK